MYKQDTTETKKHLSVEYTTVHKLKTTLNVSQFFRLKYWLYLE